MTTKFGTTTRVRVGRWPFVDLDVGNRNTPPLEHLLECGLLTARDIIDGDVKVLNVSRRNLNFRVTATTGADYFVKQALTAGRARTIGHEAAIMHQAAVSPSFERLRPYLPRFRDWNVEFSMLVFDLIPDSSSLAAHHVKTNRWSGELAGRIGAILATVQGARFDRQSPTGELTLDDKPPWILSVHRPDIGIIDRMSGAGLEVVKIAQASEIIRDAFDQLRAEWHAGTIMHGDFKWDNIVIGEGAAGKRARSVYIVDWEIAQLGDPLWDAASFLSQYLDTWIASIPVADNVRQASPPAAQVPLEKLRPAMLRFWNAYTRGRRTTGDERAQAVERIARYAAARLTQTTIEADQLSPRLSNTGILRLQVAENMLRRPLEAAASLFAISGDVEAIRD